MKHILLALCIILSIHSFSQEEIWGARSFAGDRNGGILYTIDSASNQIEIQHRFGGVIPYNTGAQMFFLESTGEWMGICSDYLFKFDPMTHDVIFKVIYPYVYGNFIQADNGFCYIIGGDGNSPNVTQINPENLDIEYLEYDQYDQFISKSAGITKLSENILAYQKGNDICKIHLDAQANISVEYSLSDIPLKYRGYGSLIPYNDKYYGLTSLHEGDSSFLLIYSYDFQNHIYQEEFSAPNLSRKFQQSNNWIGDFMQAQNGKIYGTIQASQFSKSYYMYSFNPADNTFNVLSNLSSIGDKPIGKLIEGSNNILYGVNNGPGYMGGTGKACLFAYDIDSDLVEIVFEFPEDEQIEVVSNINLTADNKLIGYYNTKAIPTTMKIFTYDLDNEIFEILLEKEWEPNPLLGMVPSKFVQLDNGNILGYTLKGGDLSPNIYHSYGVIYQFDPITKDYQMELTLKDLNPDARIKNIVKLKDDHVLLFLQGYSNSKYYYSLCYSYDVETQETALIDSISYKYSAILQESDTSLLYYFADQKRLYRYFPFSNSYSDLGDFELDGTVINLCIYETNILIYCTVTDDQSILKKYHLDTGQYEEICDLVDYQNGGANAVCFYFGVSKDGNLIGNYTEFHGPYKNYYSIYYPSKLNLQTLEMFQSSEWSDRSKYQVIDDYNEDGGLYQITDFEYFNNDCGFLNHVYFESGENEELDAFERLSIMPGWEQEEDEVFVSWYLTRLQKTNDLVNTQNPENENINIFYSNDRFIIQSKDFISKADISIYDMSGKIVYELSEHDFYQMEKSILLNSGNYVVQVRTSKELINQKMSVVN